MIIKRSLPYSPPEKTDIRSYLEKFPQDTCPICKTRNVGGKEVPGSDIEICDVCYSKHNRRLNQSSPRIYITYLQDLCTLSSYVTEIDKLQPGEEVLGTTIYTEDDEMTPTEKLCDVSSTAVYVTAFDLRFVYTELRKGYLVTETNTDISFVIPAEECGFGELIPKDLKEHPEYIELYPQKSFANQIKSEDILASTI